MSELKPIFNSLLRSRVGAVLLIVQIALTLAIVSNAAFMIHDRIAYLNQPTGYPEQDIFKFNVTSFGKDIDLSKQFELDEDAVRAIPGVINAVMINQIPISGSGDSTGFALKPRSEPGPSIRAAYFIADENFADAAGVKIISGRNIRPDEVVMSNKFDTVPTVALVSKQFAKDMFPDSDPLGQIIYYGDNPFTVVGVLDHMTGPWLSDSRPNNVVIFPFALGQTIRKFLVRTEPGMRDEVMHQIESLMLGLESQRVITDLTTMDDKKAEYVAQDRLMMRMLIALISILVVVTALGIFGLTLFNISKRTKQIGTRRALGAKKSDIVKYFIIENGLISAVGLVIGAIFAILLGNKLMTLYSLPQLNFKYVVVTAFGIFVMSLIAVYGPAKRAANISPSIATRSV
ncbi:ABC transporter permease [Pseudoalteromonas tunicata]|jgi:putative ABC transport system permease protein|uniref:ABC transporter, permease protein n=1 Tax=Pseudoalteromonas tunicata D2 TaxID=87626 RepID=A4C438_9GAMM|nr:FtsX-like permease family protein [Pseudoalteromonas tunicata]ATC97198.1 putative ABC transport system permease protein [Pseudoalteromonas tunicata]AXT33295.1 cell division protein FtsX [Pseudoalteromonas tunicata]EAR30320.1 ABC transporter, permease protein [Pseudoalteromonas tunicata D2]MDP4984914.1 ABC transporter permease [Pseudoalteromonas tunicata]MDP5214234.1 ABC transporter permease [Pseudoalteromonas tunicata]